MHTRDSEPILYSERVAHAALVAAHDSARDVGSRGHAWGAWEVASSRVRVVDGCGVRLRDMGSSVVVCGLGAIRVARRAVHAWWWGGGIDVVHERGSESIGTFVVLRRHAWSQRPTCGPRAATCGPRGALDAIHVAAHARGGMYETRERSQRAESDLCVERI